MYLNMSRTSRRRMAIARTHTHPPRTPGLMALHGGPRSHQTPAGLAAAGPDTQDQKWQANVQPHFSIFPPDPSHLRLWSSQKKAVPVTTSLLPPLASYDWLKLRSSCVCDRLPSHSWPCRENAPSVLSASFRANVANAMSAIICSVTLCVVQGGIKAQLNEEEGPTVTVWLCNIWDPSRG